MSRKPTSVFQNFIIKSGWLKATITIVIAQGQGKGKLQPSSPFDEIEAQNGVKIYTNLDL